MPATGQTKPLLSDSHHNLRGERQVIADTFLGRSAITITEDLQ